MFSEHPNLKVFFTHGGLGSQLEALRTGVPVVGLPFFSDQPYNIGLYERLGVGVGLSLNSLSEETVTSALQTVLKNNRWVVSLRAKTSRNKDLAHQNDIVQAYI